MKLRIKAVLAPALLAMGLGSAIAAAPVYGAAAAAGSETDSRAEPGASAAAPAGVEFEEGVHFQRLSVPVQTADGSRVEVVEAFSYACIHCKTFEPALGEWHAGQGEAVLFRRLPAIFNRTWALFAQAYFTAEALNVTEAVHAPIFKAIHEQGMDLRDPDAMAVLFNTFAGVPKADFDQVYHSFGVRSRLQQAQAHSRAYGITGTPSMIVDGLFRTDGQMAGSNAMMLEVVDFLVAKQAGERGIDLAQAAASD